MCCRNWSVKSPSRMAVGFIIITTNTCWQHHLLKEACLLEGFYSIFEIWNKVNFPVFLKYVWISGLYELTLDNKTISGQTVNIVQLLFLYPELATSFVYRITSSHVSDFTDCYSKLPVVTIRHLCIINHITVYVVCFPGIVPCLINWFIDQMNCSKIV